MQGLSFHLYEPAPDTAPVLSNPTESSITDTTATIAVTTDTPSAGTIYWVITTSATEPSIAQLKAASGGDIVDGGNSAAGANPQSFNLTGLTAGTPYYSWFLHNEGGEDSLVVGSGIWVTTGGTVRTHFDTYKNSVASALDFTSQAHIDSLASNPALQTVWVWEPTEYAAKAVFEDRMEPGGANILDWEFGALYGYNGTTALDTNIWFQWEFKYTGAFNDVATYAPDLDRHKTHYLNVGASAKWTFRHEYRSTAADCVGHLTVNPSGNALRENVTYSPHWNNHPYGDNNGVRYNVTHQASDHMNNAGVTNPGGFLTLPDKWIRFTCHIDCQNKTIRAWLADEDTDPVQIMSASGDLNSGFDFAAQESEDCAWDKMRIDYDTSQEDTDDGIPNNNFNSPNIGYVWNRFFLMDTSEIPLGGRPVGLV